jgi:hypothetical protein
MNENLFIDRTQIHRALGMIFRDLAVKDDRVCISEDFPVPGMGITRQLLNSDLDELSSKTENYEIVKSSNLVSKRSAEFLLTVHNAPSFALTRIFRRGPVESQGDNQLRYSIGSPSAEFSAFILMIISELEPNLENRRFLSSLSYRTQGPTTRDLRASRLRDIREEGIQGTIDTDDVEPSLLDAAGSLLPAIILRIDSGNDREDFEMLANSFLFHLTYNHDIAVSISNGFDGLLRRSRIQRVRRTEVGQLDAPRQSYEVDLVHHYMMGVSAESPLLSYLSYYHVAEHFFEKVFTDDLVEQVRRKIADPSFSIRRSKDVQEIIRTVTVVQRQVREEGGVNEQRALQLVLEKYVDMSRLAADLDTYDPGLLLRYNNTKVSFAETDVVNLSDIGDKKIFASLTKRIYKVRNALVHAKDGVRPKYAPFFHDSELSKEVPLIRFVAEQIVIATATIL